MSRLLVWFDTVTGCREQAATVPLHEDCGVTVLYVDSSWSAPSSPLRASAPPVILLISRRFLLVV